MRIGVLLIPTDPWTATVETARRLEALGFRSIWVYDHLSWQRYQDRPWHATYPWITGLAAHTSRIRFGTMVSNLNVRHPLTLAKDAMTIDHVSDGRLTLGLGAAGTGFDATALGQAPLTPVQRMSRLEEFTHVVDGLLRGELRDHRGEWYVINEARLLPGCVQSPRVPLAIAAGGPRGLGLAAAAGDAWITLGDTSGAAERPTFDVVRDQGRLLDERCAELGRDPDSIDRIFLAGHSDERPLASIDSFADALGRYGELGITDFVFHHPRADDPVWNEDAAIVEEIADRFCRR